jgi:3-oxoacyl-[acyl-carrier protein] reductase
MVETGYGKIVNVSSGQFWLARPGYPHYVASKGAVIALTRALASELGPAGVRVNAIAPGGIETEIDRGGFDEQTRRDVAARAALRRTGVPEDVVGPVLFLASAASDFVTGQTLVADGGVSYQ